uniref:Uncharacterized protein n=1 Tax=Arundo donax TaxID=35708 RepID=A0A0A9DZH0_ARUDO
MRGGRRGRPSASGTCRAAAAAIGSSPPSSPRKPPCSNVREGA